MASNNYTSTSHVWHHKVKGFHETDTLSLYHLDLSKDGHHLLVSGYDKSEENTFVYKMTISDSKDSSVSAKRFENVKYSEICVINEQEERLCVCFHEKALVAAWKTKIAKCEENGKQVKCGGLQYKARCMVIHRDIIYIGLSESEVAIFDGSLVPIKVIKLEGLNLNDSVFDIAVHEKYLFVCSNMGCAVMYDITDGKVQERYRNPHSDFTVPLGIAFSKNSKLLFILWGYGTFWGILRSRKRVVAVYCVPGGNFAAAFPVALGTRRMRIHDDAQRLFLLTNDTGEIYEYDFSRLHSFDNTVHSLESLLEKGHRRKIDTKLTELVNIRKKKKSPHQLLTDEWETFREVIGGLMRQCSELQIPKVTEVLTFYLQSQYRQADAHSKENEDRRRMLTEEVEEAQQKMQSLNEKKDSE